MHRATVVGKPYEGEPHVRFEVAGDGNRNEWYVRSRRHSLTLHEGDGLHLLFRRFVGLNADEEVWDATTFRQATLNVDFGLCNMEHPEIALRVIVSRAILHGRWASKALMGSQRKTRGATSQVSRTMLFQLSLSASHADVISNVVNSTNRGSQMKLNVRQAIWIFALAVAVTAFVTPKLTAAYQSQQDQNNNQANSKDNANNLMYQQGFDHGQADRTNNQPHRYRLQPNNADDRRAYESGYDQGYQNSRDANPYSSRQNAQNGARSEPNGSEPNGNVATQNGFQDGANDGLQDRQAGYRAHATTRQNYKHGNRGYSSSFGSKDQFKALYRQAYIQGYEKGYNGQGSGQESDNR